MALLWELLKHGSLRLLTFVSDVGARSPRVGREEGKMAVKWETQEQVEIVTTDQNPYHFYYLGL